MQNKTFEFITANGNDRFILTCEHASAAIPAEYENLGLAPYELNRHIARDKGAGEVCRLLAKEMGCAAFLGRYSRLLIDLNRRTDENELILEESDMTIIPANQNLTGAERKKRIQRYYTPYYNALEKYIAGLQQKGIKPVLFSIHSYTPQLKGGAYRPWQAGILYHKPAAFADYLYKGLAAGSKIIGENVPYDFRKFNTGAAVICGEEKGLDYALIEIRDDEFDNLTSGAEEWGRVLADLMKDYI